jgi:glycosyltransferase involved in cell wall biosynthesis
VDLLVLSEVRWGYFRTRKQFLLSRFPESWRVFFAQPPAFGADDPWTPRREGRVTYFTVPFLKPGTTSAIYNRLTSFPSTRAGIEWAAERWLSNRLRGLGVEPRPVVLVSNIYAPGALSRLSRKLLVYDFNDSPFQFSQAPEWARGYWERTRDLADAFFVVSEHYRRQLALETDRPLMTLGNGVELSWFATPRPEPRDLAALPRPRIVYLGLLSHFLDFDLLERLRLERRGGTLVLIGPDTPATAQRLSEFSRREGVARFGARPYEDVPAAMQACDLGIIPFRAQDPHVQGINPNKVYQYLASGLPVITTPILDLPPSPPELQFADTPESWARALGAALSAPRHPEACRSLAEPHDWDTLARRMVSELERLAAAS